MTQVCKKCGSHEVARQAWVNVNYEEIYLSADPGMETEWCFGDCNSETSIVDDNEELYHKSVRSWVEKNLPEEFHKTSLDEIPAGSFVIKDLGHRHLFLKRFEELTH